MIIIKHRINSIIDLNSTSREHGVEFDLHSYIDDIVVHHDPFVNGTKFDIWLDHYKHSYMFANIKEEGIEDRVIKKINDKGVKNYLLFDLSFPSIVKLSNSGFTKIALRVSKYEDISTAFKLTGKIDWIWLDMFEDAIPISNEDFKNLQSSGMKICIVSPELHGRNRSSLSKVKSLIANAGIKPDAVCTKYDNLWSL